MLAFATLALAFASGLPSTMAAPTPLLGLLGGNGNGLLGGALDLNAQGGLLANVGNVVGLGAAGSLVGSGSVGSHNHGLLGGALGLGAQGGLVANVANTVGLQGNGALGLVTGGKILKKDVVEPRLLGVLGTGAGLSLDLDSTLGLGLGLGGAASTSYHWTCPANWVRPSWYEFGYFHPTTGVWVTGQAEIVAALKLGGFLLDSHMVKPYSLVPYGLVHPTRALDLSLKGKFGFWTQAGAFLSTDLELHAETVIELLRSCGYCNAGKCY